MQHVDGLQEVPAVLPGVLPEETWALRPSQRMALGKHVPWASDRSFPIALSGLLPPGPGSPGREETPSQEEAAAG